MILLMIACAIYPLTSRSAQSRLLLATLSYAALMRLSFRGSFSRCEWDSEGLQQLFFLSLDFLNAENPSKNVITRRFLQPMLVTGFVRRRWLVSVLPKFIDRYWLSIGEELREHCFGSRVVLSPILAFHLFILCLHIGNSSVSG